VVKGETEVYAAVSRPEAKKEIDEKAGASVILDEKEDIDVKKVIKLSTSKVSVDTAGDIVKNIATLENVSVEAYSIEADGAKVGTVSDAAVAEDVLERVKEHWLAGTEPEEYKEVGFAGEVKQKGGKAAKNNLTDSGKLYDDIVSGEIVQEKHKITKGETADSIAADYGMSAERLRELNPKANLKKLKAGKSLNIEKTVYPLNLKTVKEINFEETYEEKPVYYNIEDMYEDDVIVATPGAAGLRKVKADEVRMNGELEEVKPLSYDIIKAAEPAHIIRGAKKLPKPIGIGKFVKPVKGGVFTSGFGPRWGRMHKGIDIGIKYVPVYAAGGGKVVYTGNKGDGYGIKVVIDHGDAYETLYGHLSRSFVNVGDEVYKGQHIATSGNTGDSTGPHLHFEVRVGGVAKNPLYYL
jgi:murein DD-endopeptidase MepM/ murein hydrolase activator NlpD